MSPWFHKSDFRDIDVDGWNRTISEPGVTLEMIAEYREITNWVTTYGWLNAPMSDRARTLLHDCFRRLGFDG